MMWIAMAGALLPALLSLGLRETAPLRLKPGGAALEADRAPT
ncbi:hypothetical protein [Chromobacterium sp. Beijing]|nr:hypothetical protein [Chromobacterium sp. Beijing]